MSVPRAAKFILILLANKADENYSCSPSIRTLMAESNASRSTVLRALKKFGDAWLHQPPSAIPRLRSATLDALLLESPTCTTPFA